MATQTLDEKGNIIVNGFSTNQTPAQYSNSNIPVSSIAPASPFNLPAPQSNASLYSSVVPGVQADIAGGLSSAQLQADQAAAQAEQARSGGVSLANLLAGAEASNVKDVAGVYGSTNLVPGGRSVNDLFNQVSDINARATGLNLERQGIPTAVTEANAQAGRVTTTGVAQGQTEQALRQNALKALALGQEYAIASGNYEKARNYADQLIDTKFAQETARINALKTQQAALDKYVLTPAENKRLDAVKRATDLEAKQLDQKIADQKEVAKLIIEASPFAPAGILAKAKEIQNKGGTATDVAMALGVYGKDFLSNKLLEEQIKTQKSSQASNYANVAKTNQEISDLKAVGSGGIPSKALTEGQAKDFTYAQRTSQASPKIETLGTSVTKMNPLVFKAQMLQASSPLTSGNVSSEIRQYNQAVKNFITANLRRESGAQIAPSEFNDAYQIYIPFPGDDQATLQSKKQARDTAIASFKGNVPGYDARVSAQSTSEDKYLDGVALPAVGVVEQKTTPVNMYTSRLLGLPGVK